MKILVTGANGYLGQGVVKALLDNGHSVVAADFKTNYVDDRAEKMDCDLFSVEDPYTYFGKPDVLLHLAWRDGFVHYSENHIADLPKHYHFLKQMVDAGIAMRVSLRLASWAQCTRLASLRAVSMKILPAIP